MTPARPPANALRAFVSSSMSELAEERAAVQAALEEARIEAWLFEADAGARPETIEATFLAELEASDVVVAVFWNRLGAYTLQEFQHARRLGKDCLVYERRTGIEGQRAPELTRFLEALGDVRSGVTVHWYDTPDELRERVAADLDAWRNRIVRRARPRPSHAGGDDTTTRGLELLARRVEGFWIEGALDRALGERPPLELAFRARPDLVDHPFGDRIGGDDTPGDLPHGTTPQDVFDSSQGSLLVTGEAGTGKTIQLLLLLRALLTRRAVEPGAAVPVVLHLSSWNGPLDGFADWLATELSSKYQVPAQLGATWLVEQRLVLLLDGLDEVEEGRRGACVRALNTFLATTGAAGLVVSSRTTDYERTGELLRLSMAVELLPLSDETIRASLTDGGSEALERALSADAGLAELARSPLLFDLLRRSDADVTRAADQSLEERRDSILASFVGRALARGGKDGAAPAAVVRSGLEWLARGLQRERRTLFLVEELQPSWMSSSALRAMHRVTVCVVLGVFLGGIGTLVWKTWSYASEDSARFLERFGPGTWMTICVAWLLGFGLLEHFESKQPAAAPARRILTRLLVGYPLWCAAWWIATTRVEDVTSWEWVFVLSSGVVGCSLVAALGSRRGMTDHVGAVEALGPSAPAMLRGAGLGLAVAATMSVFTPFLDVDSARGGRWGVALTFLVLGIEIGAVLRGFRPRMATGKTRINEGIRLSLRNATIAGLLPAPLFALTAWALFHLVGDERAIARNAPWLGLFSGLTFGTSLFLWFGGLAAIRHGLLRLFLALDPRAPRRLVDFLSSATRSDLLRRAGGAFQFRHRLLQQRFLDERLDA